MSILPIAYNRGHKGRIEFITLTEVVSARPPGAAHNKTIDRRKLWETRE